MGLYIEVQYRGDWWGEDGLTETRHETTGALFRALAGKDKQYPWEALGRCTSKVYIDTDVCTGKAHRAQCTKALHLQFGDDSLGHRFTAKARQVGWVFVARNPEPVNRGDEQPTGLREAWVTVYSAPPTVTRVQHYAPFGGAA